jgi:hypothetical protein
MAAAIAEELRAKDLQKLKGSDLDAFYDRLSRRGLSATSVRRYRGVSLFLVCGPSLDCPKRQFAMNLGVTPSPRCRVVDTSAHPRTGRGALSTPTWRRRAE